MKSFKKQNIKQDTKKNQLGGNKSASKINNFFKTTPKLFEIVTEGKTNCVDNTKQFYIDPLKDRLKSLATDNERGTHNEQDARQEDSVDGAYAVNSGPASYTNVHSVDANTDQDVTVSQNVGECAHAGCIKKTEEYKVLEMKYKEVKNRYQKLMLRHCELDLKHNDLIKTGTRTGQPRIENQGTFNDDIFSANEIKALKSLPLDKNKDSTFILQALKYAYKDNLAIMCEKSLYGKPASLKIYEEGYEEEIAAKDPLTPEKVERIRQLFTERLSACDIDSVSYGQRIKDSKVNQQFASGIKNIAKKYGQ